MDDNTSSGAGLGESGLGESGLGESGPGESGPGESGQGEARLGDDALDAAAALVRQGFVLRLWIFLIEPDGSLRRDLQHVDGIPVSPDAYAVLALRGILGHLLETDQEVVFVIERPAGATPSPDDWAWHDAIVRAARGIPVPLRGVLLAHRDGVDAMRPRTLAA